jgi:GST-like protein
MDKSAGVRVFESGAILLYLAEKFNLFLSEDIAERTETLNWLFWLQGSAPYLGGGFGHFYAYAPEKFEYPINRFTMEVKRQLDLLDKQLENKRFLAGSQYSIADMAAAPWYGALVKGLQYDAGEFLDVGIYKNVKRWADEIYARPAFKRGQMVNRTKGAPSERLSERHNSHDFDNISQA